MTEPINGHHLDLPPKPCAKRILHEGHTLQDGKVETVDHGGWCYLPDGHAGICVGHRAPYQPYQPAHALSDQRVMAKLCCKVVSDNTALCVLPKNHAKDMPCKGK